MPKGQFKVRPNDDRSRILVSAFQSREYGFVYSKFDTIKEIVNTYQRNKNNLNSDATKSVLKMDTKNDLEKDPFIDYFNMEMERVKMVTGHMTIWYCN